MGTKIETKSDHEWKAVRNIYDNKRHTIIGIDRPDFNITRIHDQYCTGAEITRFYFHQSSARLKNKTKYVDEVLKGNMHPDDRMHLSSDTIEILGRKDNRGNPISFDGILY